MSSSLFPNQDMYTPLTKHISLPVFETSQFDFFRCVKFDESFYGKTVSKIHQGNLRNSKTDNRYSSLFGNMKVSYWADSKETALKEMDKHNRGRDLLTIWAYDDASASYPTLSRERRNLRIVDGRDTGFHLVLDKCDNNIELNERDLQIIETIITENPDCMAYTSQANPNGVNFLFFENGFRKLAIREISLSFKDGDVRHCGKIVCANASDYSACPENYGKYFSPKSNIKMDSTYYNSDEYHFRMENQEFWYEKRRKHECQNLNH